MNPGLEPVAEALSDVSVGSPRGGAGPALGG